jgi:hypothetical protein
VALEAEPFEAIPLDFKAASGTRRFELERGNVLKTFVLPIDGQFI